MWIATLLIVAIVLAGVGAAVLWWRAQAAPRGGGAAACTYSYDGTNYICSDQALATSTQGRTWSNVTNLSVGAIDFRVWTVLEDGGFVQGVATEPGGLAEGFLLANPDEGGNATWISPDGAFGIRWIGAANGALEVGLLAALAMPHFAQTNATLSSAAQNCTGNDTLAFHGVDFTLGVRDCLSPGGPSLVGSANEGNGTTFPVGIWDGPLLDCALVDGMPAWYVQGASCLVWGSSDHALSLVWNWDSVELRVRSS